MIKQGLDYDPDGDYIRLWVPELSKISGKIILLSESRLKVAYIIKQYHCQKMMREFT